MRGKLKELWHRHLDRKPWVFRDQFGLAYLFTAQDEIAEHYERSAVIDNPSLLAWLQATVKPGETFVDLSPMIGGVTMLAARQVTETGAVFAFAPDVNVYRQLVNNVALNSLTQTVRVIGRPALASAAAADFLSLDRFATEWQLGTIDYLRLNEVSLLEALSASAPGLLKAGRIRHLLLDGVDKAVLGPAAAKLRQSGFTVQFLSPEGKLQAEAAASPEKMNLIATRAEAGHA